MKSGYRIPHLILMIPHVFHTTFASNIFFGFFWIITSTMTSGWNSTIQPTHRCTSSCGRCSKRHQRERCWRQRRKRRQRGWRGRWWSFSNGGRSIWMMHDDVMNFFHATHFWFGSVDRNWIISGVCMFFFWKWSTGSIELCVSIW